MKGLKIIIPLAALAMAAGCSKTDARKTETVKPPVAVEAAVATPSEIVDGIEVTGSLEPKFSVDVRTQVPGLVRQVYVAEWVRVRKGQPLAKIELPEVEAQVKRAEAGIEAAKANLAQTQVAANRADREMARVLKLKDAGLATQQAVDDARTEISAATARIEAGRAQIRVAEEELRQARARLSKGNVSAPIDGVVGLRDVNVGDLASDAAAAKPIFRIVDSRVLNLTVTVPSIDCARVKVGQPLEFSVDSLPGKTFTGKVMFINPELSASDRSLKVIAEVKNIDETLKGGLFAKGRILTGSRKNVLLVPRQALSEWDTTAKTASVYVVEKAAARMRKVATGAVSGDLVEVVSGLKAAENYVSRGGFNLREGDRVAVVKK